MTEEILIALLVHVVVACAQAPLHPMPADPRLAHAADISVMCGDEDDADSPWMANRLGEAVLVSDTRAITATHVLACPEIPLIHMTLADGRIFLMVERNAAGGITLLEPVGLLDHFGVETVTRGVPWVGDPICAAPTFGMRCGDIVRANGRELEFGARPFFGESGSGVWSGAELVGIVQGISAERNTVATSIYEGPIL